MFPFPVLVEIQFPLHPATQIQYRNKSEQNFCWVAPIYNKQIQNINKQSWIPQFKKTALTD